MKGNRRRAEAARTDGGGSAAPGRRSVLAGLAAVPVVSGLAVSAGPASAALAAARPGRVQPATGDLVRGEERRYIAPLLTAGTRLVLPAGVRAVPVLDYYRRPHLGPAAPAWPYIRAADGTTVDASVVPERGAPTRVAIVSGFKEGWYELIHSGKRADRVMWDARALPFLLVYGEFGAMPGQYHDRFYALTLQPLSGNPYPSSSSIS